MEIVCEQLAKDNSITGTSTGTSSAELRFLVCGTNDIEEGLAAVRSKAPKSYAGCPLSGITFDKQDSLYLQHNGNERQAPETDQTVRRKSIRG